MTAIQGQLALGVQDIYQPAQGYRFPSIALKEVPHLLCLREDRVQLVHHYLTDITLADQPHHFLESIPVHISTGESVVDEDDHFYSRPSPSRQPGASGFSVSEACIDVPA